jgi:hypothetical protein
VLPGNTRQARKNISWTNSLAYYAAVYATKKRRDITMLPGVNFINFLEAKLAAFANKLVHFENTAWKRGTTTLSIKGLF